MDKIRSSWDKAYGIYSKLIKYEEYKDDLEKSIEDIDEMISKIEGWEEKEYHLITTKSFLVCRCGGIISINDSGQDYGKTVIRLNNSILRIIAEFKDHCQVAMEQHCDKNEDYIDHKWSSYKDAAEELAYMEKMIFSSETNSDPETASVYMELICHSFNSEMNKRIMTILSLVCLSSKALTFLYALYSLSETENDIQGAADGISSYIDLLESVADETGGIVTKLGGGGIVKCNSLFAIISSLSNFFYVSYETWIEEVKITAFTKSHAHIWQRGITEEGELGDLLVKGGIETENNYSANLKKGDIKWKEDPGLHMKSKVHVNKSKEDVTKIENNSDIKVNMPLF